MKGIVAVTAAGLAVCVLFAFQNCGAPNQISPKDTTGASVAAPLPVPGPNAAVAATVLSASPYAGLAAGGSTIMITGSGIQAGAVASINSVACASSSVISATSILCVVPAAATGAITQVSISVTNPGAAAGSLANGFFYLGAPSLWLRADLGVTQTGGAVSSWADQSGSQNNANQANAGNMPALVASSAAFNNMPVIQFSGAQQLALTNLALLNNVQGATAAVAASVASTGVLESLLSYSTGVPGAGANRFFLRMNSACIQVGTATGPLGVGGRTLDSQAACDTVSGGTYTAGVAFESTGVIDYLNKLGTLSLNGTVVSTSTTFQNGSNTSPTNSATADVGSEGGADFLSGNIAEILMYNFAVTAAQRQVLDNYLKVRYALP